MDYVNLGSTGVKVSRLCLGMMTYGTPKWREWVLDEEASRPLIKRALDGGINFFDTADVYSDGVSEEVTGRALKHFGIRRDQVVVATKVFNPMGPDVNQRGLSRKHIMHAIDDSLRRLGMDYVDLYQIHRNDPDTPLEGRKSSIKTVEWEYIHATLAECDFNISEAARRLGMHRRTLARKLEKRQLR